MAREQLFAVLACGVMGVALGAQQPASAPAFEVASIKQNVSGSGSASSSFRPGGQVAITNRTLENIIRITYQLQTFQVVGGPDWIRTDRWDIVAKGEGDPPFERMLAMMKTMLADRFKLAVHQERRELPSYALVLARPDGPLGPQVKPSSVDCNAITDAARLRGGTPAPAPGAGPQCGVSMNTGRLQASARTMSDLARTLSSVAERLVVDKTGLSVAYDAELKWSDSEGPSLFTAIQEQLGLKLEAQRGPVDVLVIDRAERPMGD